MNWDAIGAIGEVVGALAVLITLIYLANQIRQSNRIGVTASEAQFRQMAQSVNRSIMELPDDDPFLAQLLIENPEYTPAQHVKARMFARTLGNLWAFADSCYRNKLIDYPAYKASIDDVRICFDEYPGIKPVWAELVEVYETEEFEEFSELWREISKQLNEKHRNSD